MNTIPSTLAGRTALVTGSTSGLDAGIAFTRREFAAAVGDVHRM